MPYSLESSKQVSFRRPHEEANRVTDELSTFSIYKYRSGASALRNLADGTAYFAAPSELNDCLEAQFEPASPEDISSVILKTLQELSPGGAKRNSNAFDSRKPAHRAELERLRTFSKKEDVRFHEACQRVGIFSAASRPDNQPMWAYYCKDSQGVCFRLEFTREILEEYGLMASQVEYTDKSRAHNREEDTAELLRRATQESPAWLIKQLQALIRTENFRKKCGILSTTRAVSVKHADWAHEQEVRIIRAQAGPLPILPMILKSVIYARTDFPEWESIIKLVDRLYPNVELLELKFQHTEPFAVLRRMKLQRVPLTEAAQSATQTQQQPS